MKKKYLQILLAGLSLSFIFTAVLYKITDYDFWIHLTAGRYNLDHGVILRSDIFTFSQYGFAWCNHEWLYQLFLYIAYLAAGFNGIVPLNALLITMIFFIAYKGLAVKNPQEAVYAWFLLLIAVNGGIQRLNVRPHVFSLFFTVAYLYILQLHAEGKLKHPYYLAALQLFWVNIHGGTYFLSFFYLGAFMWEALFKRQPDKLKQLAICLLSLILVALLNPFTYQMLTFSWEKMQQSYQVSQLLDWQPLNFRTMGLPLRLMFLLLGIALPFLVLKKNWGLLLCSLFFAALTVRYVRFRTEFLTVTVWPVFLFLRQLRWRSAWTNYLQKALLVALLIIILSDLLIKIRRHPTTGIGVAWETYPTMAARFINQNLRGMKIINPYKWGGFLSWELVDNLIFIDGRQLPGETVFKEHSALYNYSAAEKVAMLVIPRKYQADVVMWDIKANRGDAVKKLFSPEDWGLIYFDSVCLLYLPRLPKYQALLARFEYRIVNPVDPELSFYKKALADKEFGRKMLAELERAVSADPQNSFARTHLASYYTYLGQLPY